MELDGYFSGHCVLQRGARIRVRGRAGPGAPVEVAFRGRVNAGWADAAGRFAVECGPYGAGGPDVMTVQSGRERVETAGVMVGDVWVCLGQSNMAYTMAPFSPWTEGVPDYEVEIAAAADPGVSLLLMPKFAHPEPWGRVDGRWVTAAPATVRHFSAVAWYMARRLRQAEDVPLGMIVPAVGSTGIESWLPPADAGGASVPDVDAPRAAAFRSEIAAYCAAFRQAVARGERPPNEGPSLWDGYIFSPGGCFNAMVAPLTPYPVAGWVWYQGEGNAKRADSYQQQLESLIAGYRSRWNRPAAPFIVVQLPGWNPDPSEEQTPPRAGTSWAWLREQQRKVVISTPRTALVPTIDVGDPVRIHPRDKRPVGERCADAAQALLAAPEAGFGHVPRAAEFAGPGRVAVEFHPRPPAGAVVLAPSFTADFLCADGSRVAAGNAWMEDGLLIITHPVEQTAPVEVLYGFSNNPQPTLFHGGGMPVSPFRLKIRTP